MVLHHWVTVVEAMEETSDPRTEGFIRNIQRLAEYFYANYGLLVSTWSDRLQRALAVVIYIFGWVVLCINVDKMVSM